MAIANHAFFLRSVDLHDPCNYGNKSIWGLSRRGIAWSIGFVLVFLAIHAILSIPALQPYLGGSVDNLATLDVLIGTPTVGIFGYETGY